MRLPIPDAALDDRLFFAGTAGTGKTYNAAGRVERLLDKNARVVIPDPLGVWWGLRLSVEGKTPSGYDVVIFGGPHGDLPLTEHAGALIGETVAGMKESCILDLSQLGTKNAEKRFMLAFLTALYRHTTGEPLHVIFDEADMWAPQRLLDKEGEAAKLLGMMETIVRRGRVKGFIPWLLSQRPAVISKDVLSQVDGLVAFKLTSSQDRDAIGDWVEGQADKGQWREIWAQLPTMERGQGVVWLPARGILDIVQFPEKATFDSSRTPKRREMARHAVDLKPLDLGRLKDRLATVDAETKANDPKALRADIAKLKSEKIALEKQVVIAAGNVPKSDHTKIRDAEQRGFDKAKRQLTAKLELEARAKVLASFEGVAAILKPIAAALDDAIKAARKDKLAAEIEFQPSPAPTLATTTFIPRQRVAPVRPSAEPHGDGRPLGAERKPLAALASVYPAGMTEAQWAVAAGLKRTGGTWATYLSRLRTAGRVVESSGEWFVTDDGLADLGDNISIMPPPGMALVRFWVSRIPAAGQLLNRLAEIYPEWTTREQLAADLNLSSNGGTFNTYLSRLRSPGLIEESSDKQLRASPMVMDGRMAA